MGLLDVLNTDDGRMALGLLAAAGPSAVPQSFGQRLLGGLQTAQQMKEQEAAAQYRKMQMDQVALQYQQALKAAQQADLDRTLTQKAFTPVAPIEANQASGITGPRPQALGVVGQLPAFDVGQFIRSGGSASVALQLEQAMRKDTAPIKLGADESLYDPKTFKPLASNPKPKEGPAAVQEYQFAVSQGYKGTFDQWDLARKNAGALKAITNVNSFVPASEEAQKQFMSGIRTRYDQLQSAPSLLYNIDQAKALIPKAQNFVGSGADTKLAAAKFLNNSLGLNVDPEGVASAEELRTRLFTQIMDNLKKMDASPSEYQQKVMQDALGNLGTDPKALPRVLDVFGTIVKQKVSTHNREVNDSIQRGVKYPYNPIIPLSSLTPPAAPAKPASGAAPSVDDLLSKYLNGNN